MGIFDIFKKKPKFVDELFGELGYQTFRDSSKNFYEGEVNFHEEDAYQVSAKVRAFNPWPGAFFYDQKNQLVKILEGRVIEKEHDHIPSTMVQDDKKLLIACRKYLFEITKMKLPGKPAISAIDYINANLNYNKLS